MPHGVLHSKACKFSDFSVLQQLFTGVEQTPRKKVPEH
jgi:hypothetical protein